MKSKSRSTLAPSLAPSFSVSRALPLAVAAIAFISACAGAAAKPAGPTTIPDRHAAGTIDDNAAIGVRTIAPAPTLGTDALRATGQVRAKTHATLSAPLTGTLRRVLVKEGDVIREGQLLAQLDTAKLVIGVEQARAGQALADASLEGAMASTRRARQLSAAASISRAEADNAEVALGQAVAQKAQAVAMLHSAEQALREASITAPFGGVITARLKNIGDTVALMPPTPIFELVDVDHVEVRALVPESLIERVEKGAIVHGTVSPSGAPFEAMITNRGPVVDSQSHTVEVIANVKPDRHGQSLRPGTLVELDLGSVMGAKSVGLFLPSQAVASHGEKTEVVVVKDGRARRISVSAEHVLPGTTRITRGLRAEDRVVSDLSVDIPEGTPLKVVQ